MRLAISGISWEPRDDDAVAAVLAKRGVDAIELAPTKLWPRLDEAPEQAVRAYARTWADRGVRIVALQALLFGRPDLVLFGEPAARERTLQFLMRVIEIAEWLGAGVLVFGSPKNRLVGDMPRAQAKEIATAFFRALGRCAREHGTLFCIEPNPKDYGCDFVQTAAEGAELVREVNEPGFRLHLDAGALCLNHEDPGAAIAGGREWLAHFHISEPHLVPLGSGGTDHASMAEALRAHDYRGVVSVEMRPDPRQLAGIDAALQLARAVYLERKS